MRLAGVAGAQGGLRHVVAQDDGAVGEAGELLKLADDPSHGAAVVLRHAVQQAVERVDDDEPGLQLDHLPRERLEPRRDLQFAAPADHLGQREPPARPREDVHGSSSRFPLLDREQALQHPQSSLQLGFGILDAQERDVPPRRVLAPDPTDVPSDPDRQGRRQHQEGLARAARRDDVADGAPREAGEHEVDLSGWAGPGLSQVERLDPQCASPSSCWRHPSDAMIGAGSLPDCTLATAPM